MNGDLILPAGRHGPPNLDPAGLAELRVALAFRPLAPLFRGTEDGRAIMVRKEQKTSSGVRGTALIAFLLHAPHDHAAELVEGDGRVLRSDRRRPRDYGSQGAEDILWGSRHSAYRFPSPRAARSCGRAC